MSNCWITRKRFGFRFRVSGLSAGVHKRLKDAEKDGRLPRRTCHRCGWANFSEGGTGRARQTSAKARSTNRASAPPRC